MRTFSFRFFFPLFLTSLQFVGSFLFSPRHLIVIHTFPHVVQEQAAARKAACSSNVTVSRAARPRPPSFGNWGIVSFHPRDHGFYRPLTAARHSLHSNSRILIFYELCMLFSFLLLHLSRPSAVAVATSVRPLTRQHYRPRP